MRFLKKGAIILGMSVAAFYLLLSVGLWFAGRGAGHIKFSEGSVEASFKTPHSMQLIDSGFESLKARLKLVAAAKRTIEMEFFIYDIDQSSRVLTQALVKKADQGVKVRVLVDFSTPIFQLQPAYAQLMKVHGIEVRYYNTSAFYRIVSSQHRSHRKILVVDDEALITGGRNIANDYFDLGEHYNFLDSDVEVHGPLAAAVKKSFDLYWNSGLSEAASEVKDQKDLKKAAKFLASSADDLEVIQSLAAAPEKLPKPVDCRDITYVTDAPGHDNESRRVFPAIVKVLSEAKSEILAESPYFVLREGGLEVLRDLKKRSVKLTVLTNGLFSTDATYVVASLVLRIRSLAATGLTLYTYDGSPPIAGAKGRWGIHSKRAVIDGQTVIVGTYNIDPRSANLNSELIVVCRNSPELAQQMTADILARVGHSKLIIKDGDIQSVGDIFSGASLGTLIWFLVFLPVAHLFDFLL